MDPLQVFATGGASGLAGLLIFLCFKFLQSRHHLVSQCTRDGITVTADASSPKNILPSVEDAKDQQGDSVRRTRGTSDNDDRGTELKAGGGRTVLSDDKDVNAGGVSDSSTRA
jgi:hypothetical protein